MTIARPRRPLLGFKGEQLSGKSAVSKLLREQAGVQNYRSCDIEFSDPIIEAANLALASDVRTAGNFREVLRVAAKQVLQLGDHMPQLERFYHDHAGTSKCPECVMADWLPGVPLGFQITRDDKAVHRAVQMWLGVIIRQLAGEDVWAQEVVRRVRKAWPSPLVTAGGVRFVCDADVMRAEGALIVEVIGRTHNEDDDPTNAQRDAVMPDIVFYNDVYDPPLRRVRQTAAQLWADFRSGQLREEYRVSRD